MIVLDTDVLIEIFDKHSQKGAEALTKIIESRDNIATTAINLHEITYGLLKYAKSIRELLQIPVLKFAKEDAQLSAKMELETEGIWKAIRRTDAMIAAITINNGAKLYTLDLKHFTLLKTHGLRLFQ
jgi:tRNA(fMet)-specific endonuclease VapC